MKKIILGSSFLLCLLAVTAQTKQIAHKSHSGSPNEFFSSDYMDNFGLPPEHIDSIIILKNKCIVEVISQIWRRRDTVCDHPYFTQGLTEAEIRSRYPSEVVFVGFENYKAAKKHKTKKSTKKSSLHYLAILIFLGLGATYIFQPLKQKS